MKKKSGSSKLARGVKAKPRSPSAVALTDKIPFGYQGLSINESQIEESLLLGENAQAISQLVGKQYAEKLRELAIQVKPTRGGRRVLILPGILGSTISVHGETIWLNLAQIMRGKLKELALNGASTKGESNGIFWPTYLELSLKLRIEGFQAEYFHFDWRKSISEAGERLSKHLQSMVYGPESISIVAHSMGGLVVRSAMKKLGSQWVNKNINRIVLLGTPNFGSFAPALVLANDYPTVDWVQRLDLVSKSGSLVKDVFPTFTGLMEMLPESKNNQGLDLFKTENYPSKARFGRSQVLKNASGLQARIAGGSEKVWMIAGTGIETVVGLKVNKNEPTKFEKEISFRGDGTVPLALAELPHAKHRYCQVSHSSLPQNNQVILATIDILSKGETDRLFSSSAQIQHSARIRPATEEELRNKPRVYNMELESASEALEPILSMTGETEKSGDIVTLGADPNDFRLVGISQRPIVVGRKYQSRLDLTLLNGDVADARGRAIMLGVFKEVRPGGAAASIDQRMGGVLADVFERRMFSANVGEVFVIPTSRNSLQTDMVVLVGLGNFSNFTAKSLRSSVENATRTLLRCHVDEIVTVPMGGGSGLSMRVLLESIVDGVQTAMKDTKGRLSLRGLTIATNNTTDFELLSNSALELASSSRFDSLELTLDHQIIRPTYGGTRHIGSGQLAYRPASTYLVIREVSDPSSGKSKSRLLEMSLLGTLSKATVLSKQTTVEESKLQKLLAEIQREREDQPTFFSKIPDLGQKLAEVILPPFVMKALSMSKPESLTVINDLWSSQIPWELMSIDDWHFSSSGNVSRLYATSNMSIAKWLYQRRASKDLKILLVINPTGDLSGAEKEGRFIRQAIAQCKDAPPIEVNQITQAEATKERLKIEFSSGQYDIIHYAGHAYYDPENRSQSGIVCHKNEVLSGADLTSLESLPAMIVFNACESARVRAKTLPQKKDTKTKQKTVKPSAQALLDQQVSFAEAFLRGGIGCFLGTYWPVGDNAAAIFASNFYGQLLKGQSVGDSLKNARRQLFEEKQSDFANYIHYGDPEFKIKV